MCPERKEAFQSLLEYPDNDIWDWFNARTQCADAEVSPVVDDIIVFARTIQG
jgi:succinate dehydrogenase flavin-adding protein (antitoxin of CptAB toxin-antitoxin module)